MKGAGRRYAAPLAIALLALSACASLSSEECLTGDWGAIGLQDGIAGRVDETQFARHHRSCAKQDILPDRAAWQQGYEQGLRQFCTPLSGLQRGEAGLPDRSLCPADLAPAFAEGHALGLRAYDQRQRVAQIEAEIASLRDQSRNTLMLPSQTAAHDNQSGLLMLQLELGVERNRLSRIERELAAFRAALRAG